MYDKFPASNSEKYKLQLLIQELEDCINDEERDLLRHAPYEFTVRGLKPHENSKIADRIPMEIVADNPALIEPLEPLHSNVTFQFPSTDQYPALKTLVQHSTNDTSWTYAHTDEGTLGYASQGNKIIGQMHEFSPDDTWYFLESAGLDADLLASNHSAEPDVENLISHLVASSEDCHFSRTREIPIDISSSCRIVHEARTLADTMSNIPHVVQELRIEIPHYKDQEIDAEVYRSLGLPTCRPVYEDHVVFARNPEENKWVYKASYKGRVEQRDILSQEYDKYVDELSPPRVGVLVKALEAIQER